MIWVVISRAFLKFSFWILIFLIFFLLSDKNNICLIHFLFKNKGLNTWKCSNSRIDENINSFYRLKIQIKVQNILNILTFFLCHQLWSFHRFYKNFFWTSEIKAKIEVTPWVNISDILEFNWILNPCKTNLYFHQS